MRQIVKLIIYTNSYKTLNLKIHNIFITGFELTVVALCMSNNIGKINKLQFTNYIMQNKIADELYKNKLRNYVKTHLKKGIDVEIIRSKLIQSKVSPEIINEILNETKHDKPKSNIKTIVSVLVVLLVIAVTIFFVNKLFFQDEIINIETGISEEEALLADNLTNVGLDSYRNKEFDEAILSYEESLKIKPNQPNIWSELGWAYFEINRFEDAKEAFLNAKKYSPDKDIGADIGLGTYYLYNDDYEKADEYFEKSLGYVDFYADNLRAIAKEYLRAGRFDKCVDKYVLVLELDDFGDAHARMGICYLELNDTQNARTQFQKELELNPDSELGLRGLGVILYNEGDVSSAKTYLEKSIQNVSGTLLYENNLLGNIYIGEERYDDARRVFNDTIRKIKLLGGYPLFFQEKTGDEAEELLASLN